MPEPIDPFEVPDLTNPLWARASAQQVPEKPIDFQAQADAYIKNWQTENAPKPKAMPEVWRATQVKVEPSEHYRKASVSQQNFHPPPDYRIPEDKESVGKDDTVPYIDKRLGIKPTASLSGNYDKELITDMVEVGKDEGVNPYWLMATALQETNFGKLADPHKKNYGPKSGKVFNLESNPLTAKQEKELQSIANLEQGKLGQEASARRHQIRKVVQMYRNKEKIAKHYYMKKLGRLPTDVEFWQAWQGYGTPKRWKGKKVFGGMVDPVGWKDTPHGLAIKEHMKSLEENLAIQNIVEGS